VVVVEKKARIGGHTETYIEPSTGIPIDMGVLLFHDTQIVRQYFQRLDVPLTKMGSDTDPNAPATRQESYDVRTGKKVIPYNPTQNETAAAFAAYAEHLLKYPDLERGMFLPDPVPEDLIIPFGQFVKKYNMEAVLPTMFLYNPGVGDILTMPTVEQMRLFGVSLIQQLSTGVLTTAHHNNSELYTRASAELLSADSLFLSSEVQQASRSDGSSRPIKLIVRTPSGMKLIRAKRLLITIPPKVDILQPFDLTRVEREIFSKFINAGYYTSIVNNTGLPDDLAISNMRPDTPYNFPRLPSVYTIGNTAVPGLHLAYYGTPRSPKTYPLPDETVKSNIVQAIKNLQQANPDKFNSTDPQFVEYSSHAPFYLQARPEDIQKGFYARLYALQGERNTFWTGAAWRAQDSSVTWRYTEEEVLPALMEGL
jgi:hypothetical protein